MMILRHNKFSISYYCTIHKLIVIWIRCNQIKLVMGYKKLCIGITDYQI